MRGTTPRLLTLSDPGYKIQPRCRGMDFELQRAKPMPVRAPPGSLCLTNLEKEGTLSVLSSALFMHVENGGHFRNL